MSFNMILVLGCVCVVALLLARAIQALLLEKKAERGTPPGEGYTEIEAAYMSGGGGGGHITSYRVPKDPQEYAKRFVPQERRDE